MEPRALIVPTSSSTPTAPADFVRLGLRWRKRSALVFLFVVAVGFYGAFSFWEYESAMKFSVRRERADAPVTPDQIRGENPPQITEEELNGEVELIRSEDVLRKVVTSLGLDGMTAEPLWYRIVPTPAGSADVKREKALWKLASKLDITLPKKSNVIRVSYRAGEPRLAARVLEHLAKAYIEKHLAVHRSPGQYQFFAEQTELYRKRLDEAERNLAAFPVTAGTVASRQELEIVVKELGALHAAQTQTETTIEETRKRIAILESQIASTPSRITTSVRSSDNQYLMMQLKNTLLSLELKRTELLKKFEPGYRDVVEVDRQIAQTREAISTSEASPMRDETTERDPTVEWMRSELVRARTDLTSLTAKAQALARTIAAYREDARRLNARSIQQQDLLREAKTLEDNYALYLRKGEEARISDALDQSRILNVSMVQSPTVPSLPARSPFVVMLGSIALGIILAAGTALMSQFFDASFRTAQDVEMYLELPVLAALPPAHPEVRLTAQ